MNPQAEKWATSTLTWRKRSNLLILSSALLAFSAAADPEQLARERNCFTCHKMEGTRVGPSFKDMARRYTRDEGARDRIIKQIREGGELQDGRDNLPELPLVATISRFETGGQWRKVTMPPQPQVSPSEAGQLADWILSLAGRY